MRTLVEQFVDEMFTFASKFEKGLEEIAQLGQAEIVASSDIKVIDLGPGFKVFTKRLKQIIQPSWLDKIKWSCPGAEELDLENGLGVLQLSKRKLDAEHVNVRKHIKRVNMMFDVAIYLEVLLEQRYTHNAGSSKAYSLALERTRTLATHLIVLRQAELAIFMLLENTRELIRAAERVLTTHKLARQVNDKVKEYVHEIPQNDASALESGVAERRSSYYGLEVFDEAGNCVYREDGRGKYHLISQPFTCEESRQPTPPEQGLGESISWLDKMEDSIWNSDMRREHVCAAQRNL